MAKTVTERELSRFLDAWMRVRQLIQAANFNRFQSAGLSATQFMTLNLLPAKGEALSAGELARRMNLKASTVAQTVNSLETRGLLERVRDAGDGRVTRLRVTKSGAQLQNSASRDFARHMRKMFAEIPATQRLGLIEGLEALAAGALPSGRAGDVLPASRSSRRSPRR